MSSLATQYIDSNKTNTNNTSNTTESSKEDFFISITTLIVCRRIVCQNIRLL